MRPAAKLSLPNGLRSRCETKPQKCPQDGEWLRSRPEACEDAGCQTQPCQTSCEVSCETGCEVSLGDGCETTCETDCEVACETGCQVTCETGCQVACESGCEVSCESRVPDPALPDGV